MAWSREAGGGTTDLSPLLGSPLLPWQAGRTGHPGEAERAQVAATSGGAGGAQPGCSPRAQRQPFRLV